MQLVFSHAWGCLPEFVPLIVKYLAASSSRRSNPAALSPARRRRSMMSETMFSSSTCSCKNHMRNWIFCELQNLFPSVNVFSHRLISTEDRKNRVDLGFPASTPTWSLRFSKLTLCRKDQFQPSRIVQFFLVAIIPSTPGFGGTATSAADFAKILFLVSVVLLLVASLVGRKRPIPQARMDLGQKGFWAT